MAALRTSISTLRTRVQACGLRMVRRRVNPGTASVYEVYDFIAGNGRMLFSVTIDDLLDGDGNCFRDDLA